MSTGMAATKSPMRPPWIQYLNEIDVSAVTLASSMSFTEGMARGGTLFSQHGGSVALRSGLLTQDIGVPHIPPSLIRSEDSALTLLRSSVWTAQRAMWRVERE